MSLFGSFNPFKIVNNVIRNPLQVIPAAIATGGLSLVSPQLQKLVQPLTSLPYDPKLLGPVLGIATGNPGLAFSSFAAPQGGQPMAFNIGQFIGRAGAALGQSSNPYIGGAGQFASFASNFVPQATQRIPQPYNGQVGQPVMASVPAIRAGVALTQDIFMAGGKVLARLGLSYPATSGGFSSALRRALGSISSLARRTPTGTIVSILSGLGLTAIESYTLTAWYAQKKRHRRMNVCNAKALRRAGRRIRSFHKLCQHLDIKRTVHHKKKGY